MSSKTWFCVFQSRKLAGAGVLCGKPTWPRILPELHQAVGIAVGQRPQEDRLDEAEDGGVGADTERLARGWPPPRSPASAGGCGCRSGGPGSMEDMMRDPVRRSRARRPRGAAPSGSRLDDGAVFVDEIELAGDGCRGRASRPVGRRAAAARAGRVLLKDAPILLLDEVSSGLDAATRRGSTRRWRRCGAGGWPTAADHQARRPDPLRRRRRGRRGGDARRPGAAERPLRRAPAAAGGGQSTMKRRAPVAVLERCGSAPSAT
jgi:hypothetical protein